MDEFGKQLSGLLDRVKGFFGQPKIVSPLPADDSPGGINDPTQPGLNYYYQQQYQADQAAKEELAQEKGQPTPTPIDITKMADEQIKKQQKLVPPPDENKQTKKQTGPKKDMGAKKAWEYAKSKVPNLKLSQAQFNKFYNQYGDDLVAHIPGVTQAGPKDETGAGGSQGTTNWSDVYKNTSKLSLEKLAENIKKGFEKYGSKEGAKYAMEFAKAGINLPDPYLPAVLSLKETSGGKHLSRENNWLNIGPDIDYSSVEQNVLGGEGKKGFMGLMQSGLYDAYLKSGDLNEFFKVYTPQAYKNPDGSMGYNGTYPQQINQYNSLRENFADSGGGE